jgi:cytochrome P450
VSGAAVAAFPPPGFTAADVAADPYPAYAAVRESTGVATTPAGAWVVLRYDDVDRLWRDARLSVERRERAQAGLADRRGGGAMLNRDAPDHTRLRGAVAPGLADRLRQLPETVDGLARGLLAGLDGELDVVADYAAPLAFGALTHVLGVPPALREPLLRRTETLVEAVDLWWTTLLGGSVAPDLDGFRDAGTQARAILAEAAAAAGDGLLPALARTAGPGPGELDPDEVLEQALLLLMAGYEPAANLVGNTVLALLARPGQLALLRDRPAAAADAVAESLRFDSPIQLSRRYAVEDLALGGRTIPAGATIVLGIGSANRDPARWGSGADEFDLRRGDAGRHVAFGRGVHHCLGAGLAQEVATSALTALLAEFAALEPAGDVVRNGRANVRGPSRLPVAVRRR